MVNKKALSESDICDRYVTPALDTAGWTTNQWRREYGFTDGKIIVRGKLIARANANGLTTFVFSSNGHGFEFPLKSARSRSHTMTAPSSIDLSGWLSEQLGQASRSCSGR